MLKECPNCEKKFLHAERVFEGVEVTDIFYFYCDVCEFADYELAPKKCSFCGEVDEVFSYAEQEFDRIKDKYVTTGRFYVYCASCEARGSIADSENMAVRLWNKK
jgi:hypothetical protein